MTMKRATLTSTSLIILAVLFVALIIISNQMLRGVRVDLTENRLYTLSDGTLNILNQISEPVNLYFFFSEQTSRNLPSLRTYANRVQELLEEFELRSNGNLRLQIIDPQPFSEAEDRASQFGLQSIPVGSSGEGIYLGLAGTNSIDGVELIPFLQPDKEAFLEYDLSKMIYSLANPKKPVIALLSSLPMSGGFDPATRQPMQPWVIYEQVSQLYELRNLASVDKIDEDVDVLLLVHPRDLDDKTLYAVDQFILRGGRALIFVDPHAEIDIAPPNPQNPSAMFAERSSDLSRLLDGWGISVDKNQVLRDARYALSVNASPGQPPVRHYGIVNLDRSSFPGDDVVTAELTAVTMSMAGMIAPVADAAVTVTPLMLSSDVAQPIATEQVRFLPDPKTLQQGFEPTGERYLLAARLSGEVLTAFPEGPPQNDQTEAESDAGSAADPADHLAKSTAPIEVILVGDADILSDRLWVRVQDFFGQRIASAWANNADFVTNALDNLLGNSDLISMRGRATANRPFTKVQELERQADAQFRAKEQELMQQLADTEQKLNELQSARGDQGTNKAGQGIILSAEQQMELERFQERKLQIRKDLRQVRRSLDQNIEKLGNWMKFINIGLMPIILTIGGLLAFIGVSSWRRRTH